MVGKIFNRLSAFFNNQKNPLKRAKEVGVIFGENNEFFDFFWSSAEPYLIEIGNDCQITAGVKIFTHGGAKVARYKYPKFDVFGKVKIGNNVYIGNNALIMPGVSIGNNVLVAAGSVVCKSVPDNVVIGGNPARILQSIEQYIDKNLPYNTDTKKMSYEEKKAYLCNQDCCMFIKKVYLKQ